MGRRDVREEFKGAGCKVGRETGENLLGEARGGDGSGTGQEHQVLNRIKKDKVSEN